MKPPRTQEAVLVGRMLDNFKEDHVRYNCANLAARGIENPFAIETTGDYPRATPRAVHPGKNGEADVIELFPK